MTALEAAESRQHGDAAAVIGRFAAGAALWSLKSHHKFGRDFRARCVALLVYMHLNTNGESYVLLFIWVVLTADDR